MLNRKIYYRFSIFFNNLNIYVLMGLFSLQFLSVYILYNIHYFDNILLLTYYYNRRHEIDECWWLKSSFQPNQSRVFIYLVTVLINLFFYHKITYRIYNVSMYPFTSVHVCSRYPKQTGSHLLNLKDMKFESL